MREKKIEISSKQSKDIFKPLELIDTSYYSVYDSKHFRNIDIGNNPGLGLSCKLV